MRRIIEHLDKEIGGNYFDFDQEIERDLVLGFRARDWGNRPGLRLNEEWELSST